MTLDNCSLSSLLGIRIVCAFEKDGGKNSLKPTPGAVCVYAPTKPKKCRTFFEDIVKVLECNRKLVFLGDFNCVCRQGDRSYENAPFDPSAFFLLENTSRLLLEDVTFFANAACAAKFTHF